MKSTIKILTFALLLSGLCSCNFKNKRQDYADLLIEKIETFKKTNNRLPKDVSEMGLNEKMDSPAFYRMETDSTYIVWYGLTLGASRTYWSSTKKWAEGG